MVEAAYSLEQIFFLLGHGFAPDFLFVALSNEKADSAFSGNALIAVE
ncbi:hypothetical protein [Bartonella sp. LJL80]